MNSDHIGRATVTLLDRRASHRCGPIFYQNWQFATQRKIKTDLDISRFERILRKRVCRLANSKRGTLSLPLKVPSVLPNRTTSSKPRSRPMRTASSVILPVASILLLGLATPNDCAANDIQKAIDTTKHNLHKARDTTKHNIQVHGPDIIPILASRQKKRELLGRRCQGIV